jgi:hypothetical protein
MSCGLLLTAKPGIYRFVRDPERARSGKTRPHEAAKQAEELSMRSERYESRVPFDGLQQVGDA